MASFSDLPLEVKSGIIYHYLENVATAIALSTADPNKWGLFDKEDLDDLGAHVASFATDCSKETLIQVRKLVAKYLPKMLSDPSDVVSGLMVEDLTMTRDFLECVDETASLGLAPCTALCTCPGVGKVGGPVYQLRRWHEMIPGASRDAHGGKEESQDTATFPNIW